MTEQRPYKKYFKVTDDQVYGFFEDYRFLSNFHVAPVHFNGLSYSSAEAAFHAQKSPNPKVHKIFSQLNPVDSKVLGREIRLREDWDTAKFDIMLELQIAKFEQNDVLLAKLLATGTRQLYEANHWNDLYWGVDAETGRGENKLGRCLMLTREVLKRRKHTNQEDTEAK